MENANVRYTNPPELSTPTGYTHVVEVHRGRTVYIAGQVALDRSGNLVGLGDFRAQTRHVLQNVKAALASAGATFANVVKITTFVTRSEFFGTNAPASTLVQVVQLARPEFMIEVEAIAVVPE
ncbi:MAG: enamine deaminase RidA [Acidobacteria bacterium]|nr:MAG: enamine deaminase RidA [Acidobacteriota bacterium]